MRKLCVALLNHTQTVSMREFSRVLSARRRPSSFPQKWNQSRLIAIKLSCISRHGW